MWAISRDLREDVKRVLEFGKALIPIFRQYFNGDFNFEGTKVKFPLRTMKNKIDSASMRYECNYEVDTNESKQKKVFSDPIICTLVIMNIFSNAVRAYKEKGVKPKIIVRIKKEIKWRYLNLQIMEMECLRKLWML